MRFSINLLFYSFRRNSISAKRRNVISILQDNIEHPYSRLIYKRGVIHRCRDEARRLEHVSNWEIFVLSRIIFGACLAFEWGDSLRVFSET